MAVASQTADATSAMPVVSSAVAAVTDSSAPASAMPEPPASMVAVTVATDAASAANWMAVVTEADAEASETSAPVRLKSVVRAAVVDVALVPAAASWICAVRSPVAAVTA